MANLNLNGNISKNEETLEAAYSDLILFGKLFSPQDFLASATPDFHIKVGEYLLDKSRQQLALVLPRDHAKSTFIKINSWIHCCCHPFLYLSPGIRSFSI